MRGDETILLVDDEDTVRLVTLRLLQSLGYTVFTAGNGKKAVQLFKNRRDLVDLIMLDVVLPDIRGPEVFRKLRSIKPDVAVLFVTGYGFTGKSEADRIHLNDEDRVGLLQKPFTRDSLGEAVRNLLDSKR